MSGVDAVGPLSGRAVFLSASIPDPLRWSGDYDALEITDAVVAIARAVLAAGGTLVTAAHPTVAPLLLYVASEMPLTGEPRVIVYQSGAFDSVLPEATLRFEADGVGRMIRTERVGDEPPDPAQAPGSLALMRRQMLEETAPDAAVFVGGMSGIPAELELFRDLRPGRAVYPVGRPGGEARALVDEADPDLVAVLRDGDVYPALARRIVDHLVG